MTGRKPRKSQRLRRGRNKRPSSSITRTPPKLGGVLFVTPGDIVKFFSYTALAIATTLALAGCASDSGQTDSSATPQQAPSASATPTPTKDPTFVEGGNAKANQAFFQWFVSQQIAANPDIDSAGIATAVGQSPFGGNPIQYTFSRTAIGLVADSADVSVEFGGECLIAQFGPVRDGVVVSVLPVLVSGGCLLGTDVQTLG